MVDGLSFLKDVFRPEVVRKNITVPSMFKKFLDIKALFSENYKLAKDVGTGDAAFGRFCRDSYSTGWSQNVSDVEHRSNNAFVTCRPRK